MSQMTFRAEALLQVDPDDLGKNLVSEMGISSPDPELERRLNTDIPFALENWMKSFCLAAASVIMEGVSRGMGSKEKHLNDMVDLIMNFMEYTTTQSWIKTSNKPTDN